jgi:hypothetical protein
MQGQDQVLEAEAQFKDSRFDANWLGFGP